jgi:peptidyl-prolyl cis-trans isomerase C
MITVNGRQIDPARLDAEAAGREGAAEPGDGAARELVLRELLCQRAARLGLAGSEQERIDAVLAAEIQVPQAREEECRRYYDTHRERLRMDEWVEVRHILFQATARVDVRRLRARAIEILGELRREGGAGFAQYARQYSNCPSARDDGYLGQLRRGATLPEFEAAVFAMPAHTLAEHLVESRHGFHIVATGERSAGRVPEFDEVRERIAAWLHEACRRRATHQYLQRLVGQAEIVGIPMQGADTPLVQ